MMTADAQLPIQPKLIMVMGVSGSAKSTIAAKLAERLPAIYLDGDDYHPLENIAKMSRGEPLTDEDRWPWLSQVALAMASKTRTIDSTNVTVVVACSALKLCYRQHLVATAGQEIVFIYLIGDEATIAQRMATRTGHFMPTSLLRSQLAIVEPPTEQENSVSVSIEKSTEEIVSDIVNKLTMKYLASS
jgi:gluconokinase